MRKNPLKMAFGAILAAFLLLSCDENGQIELPEISIETKTVTIPAEGGTATVKASIPIAWSIETGASWFAVTPSSGQAGSVDLEFSAQANETGEAREGKAIISGSGLQSVSVTVKQPAKEQENVDPVNTPYLTLSPESVSVVAAGGNVDLAISTNVSWTATGAPDWVSLSQDSGIAASVTLTIRVAENKANDPRTAELVFSGEGVDRKKFTINQEAAKSGESGEVGIGGGVNGWGTGGDLNFNEETL